MGGVVALGEGTRIQGWALVGATLLEAETPAAIHAAWRSVGDEVTLVILTPVAAHQLAAELADLTWPLSVVMPE